MKASEIDHSPPRQAVGHIDRKGVPPRGWNAAATRTFAFGDFQLRVDQRRLLLRGEEIRIGGRALDILLTLVARAGEVVPTAEIIQAVWPNTHVEDTNLRVHMAALRKLLGEGAGGHYQIRNIPGEGYCFVSPSQEAIEPRPVLRSGAMLDLPPPPLSIIGRDAEAATLREKLQQRTCVSIVGPPGVGKTTLALHVANHSMDIFRDGVAFVDLAATRGPKAIAATILSAVRCTDITVKPLVALRNHLRSRQILVVLDNCEHDIDCIADIVADIREVATGLRVLVTSREPLRIESEWVQRLHPLIVPDPERVVSASQALKASAVQLFVDRCAANSGGYVLTDEDARSVSEICRKLDGIPLALEFAAGLRSTIGLSGLSSSLADFFMVFSRGRRTALSRHQTLTAAIEWSVQTLTPSEQRVFFDLSVFSNGFTLDAAYDVVGARFGNQEEFEDTVGDLVAKSLIAPDLTGDSSRYRLLETTRTYARANLEKSPDFSILLERHACFVLRQLENGAKFDLVALRRELANIREAADWALSAGGNHGIGIELVAAAIPFLMAFSQVDECISYVGQALQLIQLRTEPRLEIQLYIGLGWPQMHKVDGLVTGAEASEKALALARALGDSEYQLRSLWALWVHRMHGGLPAHSLELARSFKEVAQGRSNMDEHLAERMIARSHQFMGEHAEAAMRIKGMLREYQPADVTSDLVRFQYDQRTTAQVTLARAYWMAGEIDEALACLDEMIGDCEANGHSLTLCYVLADAACPITHSIGRFDLCRHYSRLLRDSTGGNALDVWNSFAAVYLADLAHRDTGGAEEIDNLSIAVDGLRRSGFFLHDTHFTGILAEALARSGRLDEALARLQDVFERASSKGEAWYLPEILRLQGEMILESGAKDSIFRAHEVFLKAQDLAERQNAKLFAIRSATSLARMAVHRAPHIEFGDRLARAVAGFAINTVTDDFAEARALLGPERSKAFTRR